MINILISGILLACNFAPPAPTHPFPDAYRQSVPKIHVPALTLLSYSGRVAPGPDHGTDPHNEVHDWGLPANAAPDPYAGTIPSDPYAGTQGWYQNPYDGKIPY